MAEVTFEPAEEPNDTEFILKQRLRLTKLFKDENCKEHTPARIQIAASASNGRFSVTITGGCCSDFETQTKAKYPHPAVNDPKKS